VSNSRLEKLGFNCQLALNSAKELSFRAKRIVFELELSDLPVEIIDLAFHLLSIFVVIVGKLGGTVQWLALPGGSHHGASSFCKAAQPWP
jgi:hypothetical protein